MANSENIDPGRDGKGRGNLGGSLVFWMVIGAAFGEYLGTASGNLWIGIVVGAGVGFVIAMLIGSRKNK